MQSPNNPLTPTEASKFPLEVLRVGPERETKGRETTTKAFWGRLKQLGGTVAGSLAVKVPGARVARPCHAHCPQDTQTDHRIFTAGPSSTSSQPLGGGAACTIGKRSVKLEKGKNASFGGEFPWPVRFQIMFCNNLLGGDMVSGKRDNSDANHKRKKIQQWLEKMN